MQNNEAIHSDKTLIDYLSSLNIILGVISVLTFVLPFFLKDLFKLHDTLILMCCMILSTISTVIIVVVSVIYNKNITSHHYRAFFGFLLTLITFIVAILT